MEGSVRQKTLSGVIWSFLDRFSVQGLQFFIGIIIARLLTPNDYGLIGMLYIFLAICQTLIDSGFVSALIQKKDRNEVDYSTVFYFNIVVGLFFYLILFFLSPYIANFYNTPQLENVAKVIFISLIINSLSSIQRVLISIKIDYKTQMKASVISGLISSAIGIWMAYSGYGVWALVTQNLTSGAIGTLLMWIYLKWRPQWVFSWKSFRQMFSFGSRVLLSSLLDSVYRHTYTLVIGKKFNSYNLGCYTRADSFGQFPSANISAIINRVTYPILCSLQDEPERLNNVYRQYLRLTVFTILPLMIGLASLSYPLILTILTEKWLLAAAILQILCFAYMWYPVIMMNQELLLVLGRSDLYFRAELIQKISGISILFITLPFGLIAMCYGIIVSYLIAVITSILFLTKLANFKFSQFLKDLFPSLLSSLSMGLVIWLVTKAVSIPWMQLTVGTITGMVYYFLISYFTKSEELKELISLIKKKK